MKNWLGLFIFSVLIIGTVLMSGCTNSPTSVSQTESKIFTSVNASPTTVETISSISKIWPTSNEAYENMALFGDSNFSQNTKNISQVSSNLSKIVTTTPKLTINITKLDPLEIETVFSKIYLIKRYGGFDNVARQSAEKSLGGPDGFHRNQCYLQMITGTMSSSDGTVTPIGLGFGWNITKESMGNDTSKNRDSYLISDPSPPMASSRLSCSIGQYSGESINDMMTRLYHGLSIHQGDYWYWTSGEYTGIGVACGKSYCVFVEDFYSDVHFS